MNQEVLIEQPSTDTSIQAQQIEQPVVQAAPQTKQENNLWAMRKKLEAEEDARKAAERRLHELEQRIQSSPQGLSSSSPTLTATEEEDLAVDNEDYVQAKHVKTSNKKFSTKLSATEKRIAELENKLAYFEAKVDTDSLKDFNEVVTNDNLETFARLYPDDYQSMMSNPNLKSKSKTAYNMIKNYGIAIPRDVREADQKIAANNQKPKLASLGSPQSPQTPLTRLGDYERRVLSEADRDRIMAEVQRKKSIG